jgi:hypothetical protein
MVRGFQEERVPPGSRIITPGAARRDRRHPTGHRGARLGLQITGHNTESVYRRYAIVSDADLQAASARLALATRHNPGHNPPMAVEARAASRDSYRARL